MDSETENQTGPGLLSVDLRKGPAATILGVAIAAVPLYAYVTDLADSGTSDSGPVFGAILMIGLVVILGALFAPSCYLAARGDLVSRTAILTIVACIVGAHLVAAIGVGSTDSNLFFLTYPLFAVLAAALTRRLARSSTAEV